MFSRKLFSYLAIVVMCCLGSTVVGRVINKDLAKALYTMSLKMPNVLPRTNDAYFCTATNVTGEELYIRRFEPRADSHKIHHIIIFGCSSLVGESRSSLYPRTWQCSHANLCSGMRILYAWGRNAPALALPPDVGLHIGARSDVNYLILQAHYAHPLPAKDSSGVDLVYTLVPQPYVAGIFLLASASGLIMPKKGKTHVDMNCRLSREPIHVFAYRVHAHELGRVVSGYKYSPSSGNWTFLAKGNPQWPQAFFPMPSIVKIESHDVIHGRCTYDSSSRTQVTKMGPSAGDEMCNLYLMYFTKNKLLAPNQASRDGNLNDKIQILANLILKTSPKASDTCEDKEVTDPQFFKSLPPGNDEPMPRNETLEEEAGGMNRNHHYHHYSSGTKLSDKFLSQESDGPSSQLAKLVTQPGWPFGPGVFGQITAVDVDADKNVFIFHRGRHVWNGRSFDMRDNYLLVEDGPIDDSTIVIIDPRTRKIIDRWGAGFFYLPHGLTIDRQRRSIWLTDVAMHQVFKFSLDKSNAHFRRPSLTLGERFKPGSDFSHFCKPTSVAIDPTSGDFYVADGYCNARIMRFDADGKFQNHWGHRALPSYGVSSQRSLPPPTMFNIPHKVALVPDYSDDSKLLACVADREHGRIQCFDAPYGQFRLQIALDEFNGRLFSIAYSPSTRIIYAVAGPSLVEENKDVMAFGFSIDSQELVTVFAPDSGSFSQPHDIAVTDDGDSVLVVEIGPNNLWMFSREGGNKRNSEEESKTGYGPEIAVTQTTMMKTTPNRTIAVMRSSLVQPTLTNTAKATEMSDGQFSFQMLKIRSKEIREQMNIQYILFVLLFCLGLYIVIVLKRSSSHHGSMFGFVGSVASSMCNSSRRTMANDAHARSEKYALSNLFTDRDQKLKRSGFNRLPQDETAAIDNDDDDDDEEENVLEDFTATRLNSRLV